MKLTGFRNIKTKKVSYAHLFCFVLLTVLVSPVVGQHTEFDKAERIYSAYKNVFKLKIATARADLDNIIPTQQELGHYHFTQSLADALEIIVTQNPNLYSKYQENEYDHLKAINELDDKNPYKLFYAAEIKMHWAIVKTLFQEDLKAGWALRSAYQEIELNIERFPDFNPNHKTYGTLQVLFAAVPESYHWILNYLGIKGNALEGYQELNRVSSKSPFILESQLTSLLITLNFLNMQEESLALLSDLLKRSQDNLLVHYFNSVALIKYARSEEALPSLNKMTFIGKGYIDIPQVYYQLGEVYLQKQEYTAARTYYSSFLHKYKGTNFIKDAWFKIFLSYWLDNQTKMAELPWEKGKKTGSVLVYADRNASDFLSEDIYPNQELFRARLATDGGYFDLAHNVLDNLKKDDLKTKKDECEYFYRRGRLAHKEGDTESGLFYYLNAIKKSGKSSWYFAPSACLQMGYIYTSRNDKVKAEYYFNKALTYKKHKYKEGIDHQAKSALEALK